MFSYFEWKPFLIGIAVGGVLLLFFKPVKETIYKYPHPKTVEKLIYRDQNGACYKYSVSEVDCDKNEGTLKEYPLQ
jgi:hypothetical protein